ncbi:hypothetical protein B296_00034283 [Ensete ventricosum]|uniref:Uncharacterized protein n=1 Tax=Ensete ventricosum TaxID=4639 RepID=A0A426Z2R5_ENSVE|nr:hypothetical protein B296_00034283 [Ensete ventricosum]
MCTQTADLSARSMSSSEGHSYTCLARAGSRAPRRYSPDDGPSVHTCDDPEMIDHLVTRGSSPSVGFNLVMMLAKYLSAPARSSTSQRSRLVYPHTGASSNSITFFPLYIGDLVELTEASTGYSGVAFLRCFLRVIPSPPPGCFSIVELAASTIVGESVGDGTADPLPVMPPDFILPRLNISAQQKLFTVQYVHSIGKLKPRRQEMKKTCDF